MIHVTTTFSSLSTFGISSFCPQNPPNSVQASAFNKINPDWYQRMLPSCYQQHSNRANTPTLRSFTWVSLYELVVVVLVGRSWLLSLKSAAPHRSVDGSSSCWIVHRLNRRDSAHSYLVLHNNRTCRKTRTRYNKRAQRSSFLAGKYEILRQRRF